jgi:hypothetical protein
MHVNIHRLIALTGFLLSTAAAAHADVCISIDSARDSLSAGDQRAALLLLGRHFEAAGEHVVESGCQASYSLTHAQLGNTILVRIAGNGRTWEAIATGMDDLTAIYSQMVRSIVTGRPLEGLSVVDRTNVSGTQSAARRIHTDSIWYARLGYGIVNGDRAYKTPAIGFGYRAELDAFALDVAFLNFQFDSEDSYAGGSHGSAQSILKLSALRYLSPTSDRSVYMGGGLSYGRTEFGSYSFVNGVSSSHWHGSGLQGELTAGYELTRATSMRVFVQVDAILPFYQVASETYGPPARSFPNYPIVSVDRRYAPSVVVSVGLGR